MSILKNFAATSAMQKALEKAGINSSQATVGDRASGSVVGEGVPARWKLKEAADLMLE